MNTFVKIDNLVKVHETNYTIKDLSHYHSLNWACQSN